MKAHLFSTLTEVVFRPVGLLREASIGVCLGWALKRKLNLRCSCLSSYLQDGVGEKIDRSGSRTRFNDQISAAAEFDAVGRMVAEVIGR